MSANNETAQPREAHLLTQDELAQIMALPERHFAFGGVTKRGKYDESKSKFYVLDDNDKLTGKVITITRRDRPPEDNPDDAPETQSSAEARKKTVAGALRKLAGSDDDADGGKEPTDSAAKKRKPEPEYDKTKSSPKKKLLFVVVAALVILALVFVVVPKLIHSAMHPDDATPPAEVVEQVEDTGRNKTEIKMISVVQVNRDLIPGDKISDSVIQEAKIGAETYNQISLNGTRLYQWTRAEDLLDKDVLVFVPRGQYLTYDNIGIYHQSANPWISEEDGSASVTVPIDFSPDGIRSTVNYGSVLDLVISEKTVKEGNSSANAASAISGTYTVQHESTVEQSYVVDTYRIVGAAVCDVLNGDQVSLYRTFTSWFDIPSGEQVTYIKNLFRSNDNIYNQLTPAYVVIRIPEADAELLGDLTGENVVVQFTVSDEHADGTEDRAVYIDKAKSLRKNIELAMSGVLDEKEATKS